MTGPLLRPARRLLHRGVRPTTPPASSGSRTQQYITRFRLEKKDPGAAVSEPVKPIVFYLSREMPEKWRPYLKKGVEDWKPAFEKAGFKNAIVCKDAPTQAEDPNWDPEDARYSVIRWVAEPIAERDGAARPRSALRRDHLGPHHLLARHRQARRRCGTSCSARRRTTAARKLPLPDDLTGELLRYVCCHEVGHTLGLRHNHRASQAYSIAQLRDPKFAAEVRQRGARSCRTAATTTSPSRRTSVKYLIPMLAPYDYFAIEWGYKPIAGAKTAEDEKQDARRVGGPSRSTNPFLRFGGEDGPSDGRPDRADREHRQRPGRGDRAAASRTSTA